LRDFRTVDDKQTRLFECAFSPANQYLSANFTNYKQTHKAGPKCRPGAAIDPQLELENQIAGRFAWR